MLINENKLQSNMVVTKDDVDVLAVILEVMIMKAMNMMLVVEEADGIWENDYWSG